MNIITSAFLAARPKTLTASLIPVWAGCMVVQKLTGHWDVRLALLTFASCLCIQIACNFFNDAIDHAKHAIASAVVLNHGFASLTTSWFR